jgi:uncharacterized protein (DUF433 family)
MDGRRRYPSMSANLTIEPRPVPLTLDETGRWRVTGTRIPLERVVQHYKAGETPEAIVEAYDVLRLSDVYAVISYYLDHKEEVEAYLRFWEARAQEVEQKIRAAQPPRPGLKEELLARWARREGEHAPPGQ